MLALDLPHLRSARGVPRGRYAPSPTGFLHVGNARTALAAWLSVRAGGGTFVWRLEDLDPPRTIAGAGEAAAEDLAWLGLDWDEDPASGGPFAPYRQSQRSEFYEAALRLLHRGERLFPCTLTRRELASIASAPHDGEEEAPYPASARPRSVAKDWFEAASEGRSPAAIRLRVEETPVRFVDRVCGAIEERVDRCVGDFVLKRRDGLYAYQLAVVVDDWTMRIDEVVRGADLLGSTARQIQLLEALGARRPSYAHVPIVRNARGEKISKRDGGLALRSLRADGIDSRRLVGYLAWTLGLLDRPMAAAPHELVAAFSWSRIARQDWVLPADLAGALRGVR